MASAKSIPPPERVRDSMLEDLVDRGELVECPTCLGLGLATPTAAARARAVLPAAPDERPTERELKKR